MKPEDCFRCLSLSTVGIIDGVRSSGFDDFAGDSGDWSNLRDGPEDIREYSSYW